MPLSDSSALYKLFQRLAHDVRNHCSAIDLDATLLPELSDDPQVAAVAGRVRKQVARIEADLKLLLLKLEDPRPITLTVDDLLQIWRMKLKPLAAGTAAVIWPEVPAGASITLDSRLTVQVLSSFCAWTWDRQPGSKIEVAVRAEPSRVIIDLILPQGSEPPADYVMETAEVMAVGGLQLSAARDISGTRCMISLVVPTVSGPEA